MMILIFKLIALTSIWVLGLTIITQDGMALYSIRHNLTDDSGKATKTIYDPIIVCHWCMPSIHSIIGYVFALVVGIIHELDWRLIIIYPIVVMGSSLVCGLVWQIYKALEVYCKYTKHLEQMAYWELKERIAHHKKTNNRYGTT
jgi:hypothetical protein